MPLSTLSDTKDPKLAFLEEAGIKTNLNELNTRYFDLITTMDAIKQFTSQYPLLTEKGETDLGKLYDKVFKTFLGFNDVIAKLDLRNSSSLIKKAFHEYKSGGNSWPGHFKSEFDELMTNKVRYSYHIGDMNNPINRPMIVATWSLKPTVLLNRF